jgi:hypothetical protein
MAGLKSYLSQVEGGELLDADSIAGLCCFLQLQMRRN